jgi:hypothetical protein
MLLAAVVALFVVFAVIKVLFIGFWLLLIALVGFGVYRVARWSGRGSRRESRW